MNKKMLYVVVILFFLVVIYQAYFFITSEGNTYLLISGQNKRSVGKVMLYINNLEKDTINLDHHFAHIGEYNLFFGVNKLSLKGLEDTINYETNIYFIGFYNWNLIEFTENGFLKKTFYIPPIFE